MEQGCIYLEWAGRAGRSTNGRAWPIGWKIQRSAVIAELSLPVGKQTFQISALEPLALPDGIVGVLDGQLRQRRGLSGTECAGEGNQLVYEDTTRPAVEDDVMDIQAQDKGATVELNYGRHEEWAARQV